ncbi:unnamed protein product [Adineta steineri]|uniref:Uncharacterized protein n=1 Tax=Adineta steineri TaxID=433720 RepID=A0A815RDS6_9BILA|nr:unnamed protein product [Adineta steineri]CAF1475772.1 unnamed protein product [Adineta steineri]CAF3709613.1 unnamed protein product [Adineta steineri]CAF4103157.1 unnamed protein product [Adineta steineri]
MGSGGKDFSIHQLEEKSSFVFYSGSKTITIIKTVTNPNLIKELQRYREENSQLMNKFYQLTQQTEKQRINSYEDLQQINQYAAQNLIKLASNTHPFQLGERSFAETGADETTQEIQPYDGQEYRLYDIPGRNDDLSYFNMEYIAFWKGLTDRIIVITSTIKEMTKVFRLLYAIHLRYDIVVNKFDLVPIAERQIFKQKIDKQIRENNLQGVDHIWYVSALNPNQFPHWLVMVDSLRNNTNYISNDFDPIDYLIYE